MSLQKGFLNQKVLVVFQATLPNFDVFNLSQINLFQKYIQDGSGSIKMNITPVFIRENVDDSDYVDYGGSFGKIAAFKSSFQAQLTAAGVPAVTNFHSIIRIYIQNFSSGFGGNTWKHYDEYIGSNTGPGYSALPLQNGAQIVDCERVFHEFLHQVDHRFQDAQGGPGTFINPDWANNFTGTLYHPPYTNPPHYFTFYTNMLKYTTEKINEGQVKQNDDVQIAPDYRLLNGHMGTWQNVSGYAWLTDGSTPVRWNYSKGADHAIGNFEKQIPGSVWIENQYGKEAFVFSEESVDTNTGTVYLKDTGRNFRVRIDPDGNAYGAVNGGNNFNLILVGSSWS